MPDTPARGVIVSAIGRELNAAIYAPGATTATADQRRPLFPTYSTVTMTKPTGRSTYHSVQLTLDKRLSRSFSVLSSYTLSKNLDHASEAKQTGASQTNPFDLEFDWGYANADRRHRSATSVLWQMPGAFRTPVAAALLNDWSLSGILVCPAIAHCSSGSALRPCATPSSSEKRRCGWAAERCCCRCRCSVDTSRKISRRSAPTSAARWVHLACCTTCRTSRTGSRRRPS